MHFINVHYWPASRNAQQVGGRRNYPALLRQLQDAGLSWLTARRRKRAPSFRRTSSRTDQRSCSVCCS